MSKVTFPVAGELHHATAGSMSMSSLSLRVPILIAQRLCLPPVYSGCPAKTKQVDSHVCVRQPGVVVWAAPEQQKAAWDDRDVLRAGAPLLVRAQKPKGSIETTKSWLEVLFLVLSEPK